MLSHSDYELTFLITTTNRIHLVSKLTKSIEEFFPKAPIIVGIQEESGAIINKKENIEYYFVGHDKGLSYTRNFLQQQVETPFFLLLDDDFLLEKENGINQSLSLMKERQDIDILGGYLTDIYPEGNQPRHYEHFISYRPEHKALIMIPLEIVKPAFQNEPHEVDMVLNFAIFRNSIFNKDISWDNNIKINSEHEDFYLNLKLNSSIKIYYSFMLKALHTREINHNYNQIRNRMEGYDYIKKKWNIEKIIIVQNYIQNLNYPYDKECFVIPHQELTSEQKRLKKIEKFIEKSPGLKSILKFLFRI